MMTLLILTALGAALALTTSTEALIAANFRTAAEGLYAAEAALDRATIELASVERWSGVLDGTTRSSHVDGEATGTRSLADGTTISLDTTVSLANCGRLTPCSIADMNAVTGDRPWGTNNPRWRVYANGPVMQLFPAIAVDSAFYVVVLVGDDGGETDGNALVDGGPPAPPAFDNPGRGVLLLRALAFGPAGARQAVQSTIARAVRTLSWSEIR